MRFPIWSEGLVEECKIRVSIPELESEYELQFIKAIITRLESYKEKWEGEYELDQYSD